MTTIGHLEHSSVYDLDPQSIVTRSQLLGEFNQLKMDVLKEQRAPLLDLSMINPDLAPARTLLDRLVEATLKPQNSRYSVARGVRRLREAFCAKYRSSFEVGLCPESNVCVTMGSKDALLQALVTLRATCSKILVLTPAYPAHLSASQLAGYEVYSISGFDAQSGLFDEELATERLHSAMDWYRPDIVLLNFPSNPTGQCASKKFLVDVLRLASSRNIVVINDFVYGELGLLGEDAQPVSLLAAAAECQGTARNQGATVDLDGLQVLETYSLSKAYSVPGWRVGALLGSPCLISRISSVKSKVDYGVFLPIQDAATYALTASEDLVGPTRETYRRRAGVLSEGLTGLGWTVVAPQAGCSVWAKAPGVDSATPLVRRLLKDNGIAVLPGEIFGAQWASFVRFALVKGDDIIHTVLNCLETNSESVKAA